MKYLTGLLFTAFLVSACSSNTTKNTASFIYSVPVGSSLRLNKNITIKANLGRTFFQNGEVIKESDVNIYYPHCSITMNTLVDYDRTLQPTEFIIYKVVDDEEYAERYIYFASISHMSTRIGNGGGPGIIGQSTYYYLKSESEPDVRTLECVQWGALHEVEYLSINEVRKSLGSIFTLSLNE